MHRDPVTCPNCNQQIQNQSRPTTPYAPGTSPGTDRFALIQREVHRVDQLILQLNEERAALLRKLNATRSPIMALPTETLSSIFECACPPEDFSLWHKFSSEAEDSVLKFPYHQYPQFTLGVVSSSWRQAVHSNPRLWTRVALNVTPANVEKKAKVLQLFIENSKEAPLAFVLNYSYDIDPNSPYLVHENIDSLLIETMPRIKTLHLVNPPRQWHNHTMRLTQLNDCSLDLLRPKLAPDDRVILPIIAPLRQLSLQAAFWVSNAYIQLPWTTLTSLNLSFIPPDLSVQVLVQCPNLVDFYCQAPTYRRQPPPGQVSLTNPISLPHLATFHWEAHDSPWSRALIRYLHAPVLKTMFWNTFSTDPDNNDIRAFFGRLPPTLTTVGLGPRTTFHLEYIPDALNIQLLILCNSTTRDVRTLFHKLKPNRQEGQVVKPFSRLEKISLVNGVRAEDMLTSADTLDPSYADQLIGLLEQRLDHHHYTFSLDTETTTFVWGPEALARLAELTNKGYDIELLDDSGGDSGDEAEF